MNLHSAAWNQRGGRSHAGWLQLGISAVDGARRLAEIPPGSIGSLGMSAGMGRIGVRMVDGTSRLPGNRTLGDRNPWIRGRIMYR